MSASQAEPARSTSGPSGCAQAAAFEPVRFGHAAARPIAAAQLAGCDPRRADTSEWSQILQPAGVSEDDVATAEGLARRNRTTFLEEIVHCPRTDEAAVYSAVAARLRLPRMVEIEPGRLIMRDRHRRAALQSHRGAALAMLEGANRRTEFALVPQMPDLDRLSTSLRRYPDAAQRLSVASPSGMRQAVLARARPMLIHDAEHSLFERLPHMSARIVANAWQGAVVGAFCVLAPVVAVAWPATAFMALHLGSSVFFLLCVMLRVLALRQASLPTLAPLLPVDPARMPVYTVLVALYREKAVVPQLLVALGRLNWPRSKLRIKLVCEADDLETIAALRAHTLSPCVEIVEVPAGGPRTKPKALQYALACCGGEFVALYDAEDRPHAMQLVEAWQAFERHGPELACVQAPLVVSNVEAGLLSRLFAFEYSALFRGLLPYLSRRGGFFPLGGTSNHFRRSALLEVGGWDPHNVTEDADLGLRLHRFGYATSTITRPTFEDAPETLRVWLPQRTRWFKGWLHPSLKIDKLLKTKRIFSLWREPMLAIATQ